MVLSETEKKERKRLANQKYYLQKRQVTTEETKSTTSIPTPNAPTTSHPQPFPAVTTQSTTDEEPSLTKDKPLTPQGLPWAEAPALPLVESYISLNSVEEADEMERQNAFDADDLVTIKKEDLIQLIEQSKQKHESKSEVQNVKPEPTTSNNEPNFFLTIAKSAMTTAMHTAVNLMVPVGMGLMISSLSGYASKRSTTQLTKKQEKSETTQQTGFTIATTQDIG